MISSLIRLLIHYILVTNLISTMFDGNDSEINRHSRNNRENSEENENVKYADKREREKERALKTPNADSVCCVVHIHCFAAQTRHRVIKRLVWKASWIMRNKEMYLLRSPFFHIIYSHFPFPFSMLLSVAQHWSIQQNAINIRRNSSQYFKWSKYSSCNPRAKQPVFWVSVVIDSSKMSTHKKTHI